MGFYSFLTIDDLSFSLFGLELSSTYPAVIMARKATQIASR